MGQQALCDLCHRLSQPLGSLTPGARGREARPGRWRKRGGVKGPGLPVLQTQAAASSHLVGGERAGGKVVQEHTGPADSSSLGGLCDTRHAARPPTFSSLHPLSRGV